jgi:hypothetical protein
LSFFEENKTTSDNSSTAATIAAPKAAKVTRDSCDNDNEVDLAIVEIPSRVAHVEKSEPEAGEEEVLVSDWNPDANWQQRLWTRIIEEKKQRERDILSIAQCKLSKVLINRNMT